MVDGSNESLYHPDEESDPILRKGIPLQKSFQKVDVCGVHLGNSYGLRMRCKFDLSLPFLKLDKKCNILSSLWENYISLAISLKNGKLTENLHFILTP